MVSCSKAWTSSAGLPTRQLRPSEQWYSIHTMWRSRSSTSSTRWGCHCSCLGSTCLGSMLSAVFTAITNTTRCGLAEILDQDHHLSSGLCRSTSGSALRCIGAAGPTLHDFRISCDSVALLKFWLYSNLVALLGETSVDACAASMRNNL